MTDPNFFTNIVNSISEGVDQAIGDLTKPWSVEPGGLAPVYYAGLPGGAAPPAPITAIDQPTGPTVFGTDIPWVNGPPNGETDFYRIDTRLQGLQTRIVYIGVPDPTIGGQRRWWDLHGNYGGAQGLMCGEQFAGLMHAPFESKIESGAYEIGGTYERTDWGTKEMSLSVLVNVGVGSRDSFTYRTLEDQWWNSWSDEQDGWLGVFVRGYGWRFIPVRLKNASKTAFEIDPAENDNNFMQWDMEIVSLRPFFNKKSIQQTWQNTTPTSTAWNLIVDAIDAIMTAALADLGPQVAGSSQILGDYLPARKVGAHVFSIANKGTVFAYPKYVVSSPGIAWIQNGWNADGSPQMLQLPLLTPEDGYVLVDTDPDARTLTCATDPQDPLFMQILSNVSLLEILLGPIIDSGKPIWQQFKYTFTEAAKVPPRTVANLHAWHSEDGGTITCIMPQGYKMAWG
jgi:hypothetical protein